MSRMVPQDRGQSVRARLIAAGRLISASSPTGRLRSSRPAPVAEGEGEPTNQQLIDEGREERL